MSGEQNREQLRDWFADFVFDLLRAQTMEGIVARLDAAVLAGVPELDDPDMRRDLAASTRAHARVVLSGLASDTVDLALPEEAHALARTIARRGLDVRVLLRAYRTGMAEVLAVMTETVAQGQVPPEIERAVLLRVFERSTTWIGLSVEALTGTFMAERERVLRDAINTRTELVHALLTGTEVDVDQASIGLGYRLSRRHLAFVLWTGEAGGDEPGGLLDRAAARIATVLGATGLLTVAASASGLWAWAALDDDAEIAERIARCEVAAPVRVAFGMPGAHVDGFVASHREAVAARRVAEQGSRAVTSYREVEIAYLAGVDTAAMRGLIARELHGLTGIDPVSTRLRATLHAYLRAQRSPEEAARLLGVHKNTVRYRIHRVEEILGHPVSERALALEIALDCVAAYGVS
ncbi:PucR family transcriptional regulator [Nocardia rhizosphaerihabitans]|uniref:PucR family transcriptional regulator n=1 Tax=Nocardia rhizosphaerihabitans TaxID=1691570 RepID=UPI001E39A8B6|nr:helix-turn-helix domain-containing protein [Nocardia rhizosphaerihabitans]